MKKSMISLLIKSQGKQHIPMLRLNQSLAGLIPLTASPNAVITMTNTHLAPNKLLRLLSLTGLILSSLTFSTAGYAALSATTANTIKGTPPALSFSAGVIANDLDELVSLTMPDPAGGATPVDITPTLYPTTTTPINAKAGVKFSDFTTKVTANNTALTLPAAYFYDADGDTPDPIAPVGGTLKATWTYQYLGATKTVTVGELGDVLDACNAPYTLTLDANNVSAKSEYGDPNLNNYGSKTHTYTINVNDYKICYAKPANMNINDGVSTWATCTTASCAYASGYNADVFVPTLGFIPKGARASAAANGIANFPTSGFDGATFTLVMSHNQGDYGYQSSDPVFASVNASGEVTLNNGGNPLLGNQTVTITATPAVAGFTAKTYQFTVLASQWARVPTQATPTGTQYNTNWDFTGTYPAAELCGAPVAPSPAQLMGKADHYGVGKASSYFFSRSDFTKSPIALIPDRWDVDTGAVVPAGGTLKTGGNFSRDINGAFNDEWGSLNNGVVGSTDYPLSGFGALSIIWTAEAYDSVDQFVVISINGGVGGNAPLDTRLAVCR